MLFGWLSFLGAFALFLIEPFLGKALTPRFGGGAQVWMVCMLFFQLALLGGYAYAHLLTRRLDLRRQRLVHAGLLGLVMLQMGWAWLRGGSPLLPSAAPASGDPVWGVLSALASVAALPMVALAATSPLIQHWRSRARQDGAHYRLYAWSNSGSLGGLLAYPFLVEPALALRAQAVFIAAIIVVFSLALSFAGPASPYESASEAAEEGPEAGRLAPLTWVAASAAGAMLLLAATNKMTFEIVAVPLLWILPLALYLLSFILIFDGGLGLSRGWWPAVWSLMFGLCLVAAGGVPSNGSSWIGIAVGSGLVFSGCMLCHGVLFESRPRNGQVTRFYLFVASGGAIGGILVALLVPLCFDHVYELGLSAILVACLGAALARRGARGFKVAQAMLSLLCLAGAGRVLWRESRGTGVFVRNFYGVVHIQRVDHFVGMENLKTLHGFLDLEHPEVPLAYYTPDSGIGRALRAKMAQRPGLKVGVVGLGLGSVADYGRPGDRYTFYEINPAISAIAGPQSTAIRLLRDSRAGVELLEGDGRIMLESELRAGAPRGFDVLMVDAFSGDAVPWHLITVEAFQTYLAHLAPDGLLVLHVSNPLPVDRIALDSARATGLYGVYILDPGPQHGGFFPLHMSSEYLVLAKGREGVKAPLLEQSQHVDFGPEIFAQGAAGPFAFMAKDRPWTDDLNSSTRLLVQESALQALARRHPQPKN